MAKNSSFGELFSPLNGMKVAGVMQTEADWTIVAQRFRCRATPAPKLSQTQVEYSSTAG
jgi:hypothetical protein